MTTKPRHILHIALDARLNKLLEYWFKSFSTRNFFKKASLEDGYWLHLTEMQIVSKNERVVSDTGICIHLLLALLGSERLVADGRRKKVEKRPEKMPTCCLLIHISCVLPGQKRFSQCQHEKEAANREKKRLR